MFHRLRSLSLALVAPLALWGCVITPGKFVSTLTINADRTFAFTYVGEVYAVDLAKEMSKGMGGAAKVDSDDDSSDDGDDDAKTSNAVLQEIGFQKKSDAAPKSGDDFADLTSAKDDSPEDTEKKNAAIAEALSKEAGYRKVQYLGQGKFQIDYAISGRLTYNFIYPFNVDAEAIFPFIAIELRGADKVRVKAPAFAAQSSSKGVPGPEGLGDKLDGTFTLTTDAEVVSQNNENGASTVAGKKVISWKASPTSKDAPMAVLKVAPLAP